MDKELKRLIQQLMSAEPNSRQAALPEFIRATFKMFFRRLFRALADEHRCEDILLQVYVDILQHPYHLRKVDEGQHNLLTTVYLYYMRKHLKRAYRERGRSTYVDPDTLLGVVAPQLDVLDQVSNEELKQFLDRAIRSLKPREQKAIRLWMGGASYREIATQVELNICATKVLMHRTLRKLRSCILRYMKE